MTRKEFVPRAKKPRLPIKYAPQDSMKTPITPGAQEKASQVEDCLFLALPGEIRNRIYEYVFGTEYTVAIRPHGTVTSSHPMCEGSIKKSNPPKAQRVLCVRSKQASSTLRTFHYSKKPGTKPLPGVGVRWGSSPTSLLLSCKRVGDEAAGFLYSNTVFFFEDPRRIAAFIETARARDLHQITKVKLFIQAYGIPCASDDTRWEDKHVDRWTRTLGAVVESMPNIEALELTMHLPNMPGFLSRAFKTARPGLSTWRSDAGPLLIPQPLSKLQKLKKVSIRTSSRLLSTARDPYLVADMYAPHFEVQGIYHPSRHQHETVFLHNKTRMEELHAAANRAIKKLVQVKSEDTKACFAELLVVTKEWQEWAKDPIGNSLRAGMALPQPPPPPPLPAPAAPAPAPASAMAPPANLTATSSPVSSHPQNEAKNKKRKGKGKDKPNHVDLSSPAAPTMGPALMALTLEMSTPVPDTSSQDLARFGKKKTKSSRGKQTMVAPAESLPSPARLVPAWFLAGVPKLPTADDIQSPSKGCGRDRKQPKLASPPASSRSNFESANTMNTPALDRSLLEIAPQPILNVTQQKRPSSSDIRRRPTNPVHISQPHIVRFSPVEPASANTSVAAAKSMQSSEIPTQRHSLGNKSHRGPKPMHGLQPPSQPSTDPTNDTSRQPLLPTSHRINARGPMDANEKKAPNKLRASPAPISTGSSGVSSSKPGMTLDPHWQARINGLLSRSEILPSTPKTPQANGSNHCLKGGPASPANMEEGIVLLNGRTRNVKKY